MAKLFYKKVKENKETPKSAKRGKTIALVLFLILIVVFVGTGMSLIARWFDSNRMIIKSPVVLQNPIQIEKRMSVVEIATASAQFKDPESAVEAFIKSKPHGHILWGIYGLESTWGKNDPCLAEGQYNGFGYAPGTCYGSIDEVVDLANIWFDNRLLDEGLTLSQALCYYQSGTASSDCEYYQKYLAIIQ